MFTDGEFTIFSVSMFQRFTNVISEEVSSLALETPLLPQLLRVSFCGGVCIFIAVVFFLNYEPALSHVFGHFGLSDNRFREAFK